MEHHSRSQSHRARQFVPQAHPSAVDVRTEMVAWQALAHLVDTQRQMIIAREHEGLPELNKQLAQAFARVSQMRRFSGPPALRLQSDPRAGELDILQRRVRAAAKLNRELISDALAYVDFSLELMCPQIATPVYDQKGQLGKKRLSTTINRSV